ncbi:MAG: type II secretion system protein [Planctomycetota bacterium]|jgi:general secretion pathway protein G
MTCRIRSRSGFTLVELLIVVIILGILAAVVVPQFNGVTEESKESTIAQALRTVRQAIELYKLEHNESWPDSDLIDQLTLGTDVDGDSGTTFGPYLRDPWPRNPLTGTSDVKFKNDMPSGPEGGQAWIYAKNTGDIRCNTDGNAPSGKAWFDL